MLSFFGEHIAKVDEKGRIVLPAPFKKQMEKAGKDRFIARKEFNSNCIVLYTEEEWQRLHEELKDKSDPFDADHRMLMRLVNKSVFEITVAENGRMLIPKRFLDMIGIRKDVIIAGQVETIEIWDKATFESMDDTSIDFTVLRKP
jgi:MraZ protein